MMQRRRAGHGYEEIALPGVDILRVAEKFAPEVVYLALAEARDEAASERKAAAVWEEIAERRLIALRKLVSREVHLPPTSFPSAQDDFLAELLGPTAALASASEGEQA